MFDGLFEPTHLIIILVICLLVFGPKKLPELGKGLGESIREFKKSMAEARAETPASKPVETAKSVEAPKPTEEAAEK